MIEQSYVLKSSPNDEEFLHELNDIIEGLGLETETVFLYEHSKRIDPSLSVHLWTEHAESGASVEVAEDLAIPARWIHVKAPTTEKSHRIAEYLSKFLPIETLDELHKQAKTGSPSALTRLALGINATFDQEAFDRLVVAIKSSDLQCRVAAIGGMFLLKWPQFVAPLQAAMAGETNEEAMRTLRATLAECQGDHGQSAS